MFQIDCYYKSPVKSVWIFSEHFFSMVELVDHLNQPSETLLITCK